MNIGLSVIMFLAFTVRVAAIFLLGRHIAPELWEYNDIALNIIHNKGYITKCLNTDYRSLGYPFYPILSAVSHFLTHENYFVLEMLNVVLSVLVCYLIYRIAEKIFNAGTALISSFLVAMHPGLIVYSTKIHELTLVVFFMTLLLWLIIRLDLSRTVNNVLIGLIIGIGTLTRPTIIFFLPVYFIYVWLSSKRIELSLRPTLIVCLAAILAILPWTIRNYDVHKKWIFITTSSAEHFWRGNNPTASGTSLTQDNRSIIEVAPLEFREKLYSMKEIEQYDLFYKDTLKFIKSDPPHFINMIFKKFIYFWWYSPQTGLLYPAAWKIIYLGYYMMIFLLFIVGLCFSFKSVQVDRAFLISICLFLVLISGAHSLYYIETRHRWMIEPFMIIFSSYGAMRLFTRHRT